ncbi:MAG: hypothetical protein KatS3mg115_1734 [Candidatus Poribacteria bacterium]|nr:MAG: hypothetical protein KatS3mg115_1734 [Candidatus Poribacteria bacterium]
MRTLSPLVLYDGTPDPPAERIFLQAGPMRMVFEPDWAFLRYLRVGSVEVLRGLYVAVRDANWDTVPPHLERLRVEEGEDSFRLSFEVICRRREIHFFWRGEILGEPDGTVQFSMDGEARSTFRRNRIGFCVLHPAECAGSACRVMHTDGSVEESRFPEFISPHQPFFEIRAIAHEVAPGLWAEVRLEGDVFEMEDQRNWTDASFKTYCTPLALPFPVEVPAGTRIQQRVTVRLLGALEGWRALPPPSEGPGEVVLDPAQSFPLPPIGLGIASHGQPLSAREVDRLRRLHLSHLRVDLCLSDPSYARRLERAWREAETLGAGLEVAFFLSESPVRQLEDLIQELERVRPHVVRFLVFHESEKATEDRWVRLAQRALADFDPSVPVGGGTNAYFTELNRNRPQELDSYDFACYSINPQVHAFDNASLVETLPMQAETIRSARTFLDDLPVVITPITLRPRFNPNATGPEPEPEEGELPSQVDARQMSLLGAGWTLGSLAAVTSGGVASVTYYETTGWRGVMETEAGSPLPERFPSIPGGVFPMYHVFADVGEFAGASGLAIRVSDPLSFAALALEKEGWRRVLIANLTFEPQTIVLRAEGLEGRLLLKTLDERNAESAMAAPEAERERSPQEVPARGGRLTLELLPYGIARLDWIQEG